MRFGRQMRRVEDLRLTTGRGRYTDNLHPDNMAILVLVRSPHAHARILNIDVAAARAAPGVLAVYTGQDLLDDGRQAVPFPPLLPGPGGRPMAASPRRMLAVDAVRHVGEEVVAIIAETRAAGHDAAELVVVEYDILPAVIDMRDATAAGAPAVWPEAPDNIACEMQFGDAAAAAAAFAKAAHVIRLDLVNQRLVCNPIERRVAIGDVEAGTGRSVMHIASQSPSGAQGVLAEHILKRPAEQVRVVVGDIGGGFGLKAGLHMDEAMAAYAASKLQRPVKFVAERSEEFQASAHGRDHLSHAEMALDGNGKILGVRVKTLANLGSNIVGVSPLIPVVLGPKVLPCTYQIPSFHLHVQAILTHTMTVSAYRGAGRPEGVYVMERLMDEAAARTGIDPVEIRRRNMVEAAQMPFTNAMGEVYDTGDFAHMLEQTVAAADYAGFAARKADASRRGKLLGRGVSSYIEWTGAYEFTETVDVIVSGDGRVLVNSATQAMGQGLETAYTGLIADKLGVDPSVITVFQGDTDVVKGPGSFGSRSAFVGGSAVAHGADTWVETATPMAADALEAGAADIVFGEGKFSVTGTDRGIGIFDLAGRQPEGRIAIKATHSVPGSTWPNGCHICEIEIDPETGDAQMTRYTTTDDVGTALNPMLVEGQIHGGIVQGAGQALHEHCVYDRESGQLITGSFMDYRMPRAQDFPSFRVTLDQSMPATLNPLGVKGCGESGTVGATPAVVNAVLDALRPLGVGHIDMPASPFAIWQAISAAKAAA